MHQPTTQNNCEKQNYLHANKVPISITTFLLTVTQYFPTLCTTVFRCIALTISGTQIRENCFSTILLHNDIGCGNQAGGDRFRGGTIVFRDTDTDSKLIN